MSISKVELNTEELKEEIKDMISINKKLQEDGEMPITIGIEGHAGIGKTSCVLQAAIESGISPSNVVRMNLAELEELGD